MNSALSRTRPLEASVTTSRAASVLKQAAFHFPRIPAWLPALVVVLAAAACGPPTVRRPQGQLAHPAQSERELVDKAMEYLERLDQFREQQALAQAAYHLNRWIETQALDKNWTPDERVSRLPRIVREQGVESELGQRRFTANDIQALQEAVWMRQIAQWASRQPLPTHFSQWLEKNSSRLGEFEAEQLAIAYRLFDWTVRNIQLTELMQHPEESAGAPVAGTAGATQASLPAALRGVPGPGYHLTARHVLLYGQGDVWQRMRVFTLLARQQGIEAVTLGFPGKTIPPRPRPWVSAVLIKGQLYLFDAQLGLPIPGKDFEGVATLEEVLADRSLLRALEIDDQHPYRVDPQDLGEIAALLDVTPSSLSQRFQLLESQLVGDHRTVLTVPLTPLSEKLKQCRGVYDVYVWSVPFEAVWYHDAHARRMQEDERAGADHVLRYGIFFNHTPLARARYLYFQGRLDTADEEKGAKELLMESRVNQDELDQLTVSEEVQRQMGLQRSNRQSDAMWQAQLSAAHMMMSNTKQYASFWLGLFQFESGRYDSAIEWFRTRSLGPWPDGMWAAAARYNLARAYESLGELGKAQEVLLADTSLQEHGNYLRARILQQQMRYGSSAPEPSPTTAPAGSAESAAGKP